MCVSIMHDISWPPSWMLCLRAGDSEQFLRQGMVQTPLSLMPVKHAGCDQRVPILRLGGRETVSVQRRGCVSLWGSTRVREPCLPSFVNRHAAQARIALRRPALARVAGRRRAARRRASWTAEAPLLCLLHRGQPAPLRRRRSSTLPCHPNCRASSSSCFWRSRSATSALS